MRGWAARPGLRLRPCSAHMHGQSGHGAGFLREEAEGNAPAHGEGFRPTSLSWLELVRGGGTESPRHRPSPGGAWEDCSQILNHESVHQEKPSTDTRNPLNANRL